MLTPTRGPMCKRVKPIAAFLSRLGVPEKRAWITALSGKGWWRLSGAPSVQEAPTLAWLDRLGLLNLKRRYAALQHGRVNATKAGALTRIR